MRPKEALFSTEEFKTIDNNKLAVGFLLDDGLSWEGKGKVLYCIDYSKLNLDLNWCNTLYGVTHKGKGITILPGYTRAYEFGDLQSLTIEAEDYIMQMDYDISQEIRHATLKTRYKEIIYGNEALNDYLSGSEIDVNRVLKVKYKSIGLSLSLFSQNIVLLGGKDNIDYYLEIKLSKSVSLKQARKIIERVDAAINLCMGYNYFSTNVGLRADNGLMYSYNFSNYPGKTKSLAVFNLFNKDNPADHFLKSFNKIVDYDDNIIMPLLYPQNNQDFLELQFLRYYVAFEAIRKIEGYDSEKNQDKYFLEKLLDENKDIKNKTIGREASRKATEEMIKLRNQYAHFGFVIEKGELEIGRGTTKYVVRANRDWVAKRVKLLKGLYYKYLLEQSDVDSKKIKQLLRHELLIL